jgi:phage gpG-like protein
MSTMSTGAERAFRITAAKEAFMKSMATIQSRVFDGTRDGLRRWASGTIAQVIARHISGRPGLISRTGNLMRSLHHRESGSTLNTLKTVLWTSQPYAHIQEFGGTVRPKSAKMLAIPFPGGPATGPTGMSLYASPLRSSLPEGMFIWKSKKGNLILGRREGQDLQPWFILKSSVTIPPRLGFRETVKQQIVQLQTQLGQQYRQAIIHG